ncbi:hypothetical protein Tco_0413043 [Tanacetum coccineum]
MVLQESKDITLLVKVKPKNPKDSEGDARKKPTEVDENEISDKSRKHDQEARSAPERLNQREMQTEHTNSTNGINTVSTPNNLFVRVSPFKKCIYPSTHSSNISTMDNTASLEMLILRKDAEEKFQMSSMRKLFFIFGTSTLKQKSDGIFISQDRYVAKILKKFDFASVKTASTPMETNKALVKDEEAEDVFMDHRIRNQMLDYGFNFMNTKIYIDNESTICVVKNPVSHSKTKHIEIRHHFIRDSYEKRLIQVIKIHTDQNVADLLTKAFDVSRVKTAKDKHIEVSGKSKEVKTLRYLSLVVPLKKVGDEAVHKELGDKMERATTTASSLEAKQDRGSGPRCQDTILGDVDVQTRFETTSKQFNDPPLSKVNTFGSGEDNMQLMELMAHSQRKSNQILVSGRVGSYHSSSGYDSQCVHEDLLQKVPHHGIDLWLQVQFFYDHVYQAIRNAIDHSTDDVPSTSDHRLIDLENQVQLFMEAHLAPKPSVQVNKITSSCKICGGPHDTQYCKENHE